MFLERILNDNEKIRKAEEIYYRRNNRSINIPKLEGARAKTYLGSRILLQFVLLINIAIIIFAIQNKDYIFRKEFLTNLNQYNIDVNSRLNSILNFINTDELKEESNHEQIVDINNSITDEINTEQTSIEEKLETQVEESQNVESSLSQMDMDVQNLKNAYTFAKPVEGTVSSLFGARESQYQNVKGYHTGIDIAAETGTVIKSAFTGMVTLVSSEGDYRKSYKSYL